jgi:hypothetical protein
VSKQPLLALDPTAIAGKTCVGADDAVTRDHDGDTSAALKRRCCIMRVDGIRMMRPACSGCAA